MVILLKYLILSIFALSFNMDDNEDIFACKDIKDYYSTSAYTTSINISITTPKTDICIPRQISTFSVVRLQSNSSRHKTCHRHNNKVIRSVKTVNSITRHIVQKYSSIIHFSIMEPANKLVILHRLIN